MPFFFFFGLPNKQEDTLIQKKNLSRKAIEHKTFPSCWYFIDDKA